MYTQTVMCGAIVVGHVLKMISAACTLFWYTMSGNMCFSTNLPQEGFGVRNLLMPTSTIALEPQSPSKKSKIDCSVVELGDNPDDLDDNP